MGLLNNLEADLTMDIVQILTTCSRGTQCNFFMDDKAHYDMLNIHEQILHVPKTDGNFLSVQHTSAPSIWRASRKTVRKL